MFAPPESGVVIIAVKTVYLTNQKSDEEREVVKLPEVPRMLEHLRPFRSGVPNDGQIV